MIKTTINSVIFATLMLGGIAPNTGNFIEDDTDFNKTFSKGWGWLTVNSANAGSREQSEVETLAVYGVPTEYDWDSNMSYWLDNTSPFEESIGGSDGGPGDDGGSVPLGEDELKRNECIQKAQSATATCNDAYATLNVLCQTTAGLIGRGVGWTASKALDDAKLIEAVKSGLAVAGIQTDLAYGSCSSLDQRAENYCTTGGAKLVSKCN